MPKNYWVNTRPKRKLILIPDILRVFESVASGQEWHGNRKLQLEFEKALTDAKWKAQNISRDGSGGRTYAALLFMLGLWFEDENGVQITNAGEDLIDNNPPAEILTKQLMNLQYPSPYSIKSSVNVSSNIKIHPHRFIVRLFIEKGFSEITQDEIAFCLVPFCESDRDIEKAVELINEFRESPESVTEKAVERAQTSEDNLRNIGNTFVNQLEITGFFIERDELKSLSVKHDKKDEISDYLSNMRQSFIQDPSDSATFQMRYGSGIKKSKDYRYSQAEPMAISPNERKILVTYYTLLANEPISSINSALISKISIMTGAGEKTVESVLNKLASKPKLNRFEEKYLQLSKGGRETATEFEVLTTGIFSDQGFGFPSEWIGSKGNVPDIIVYIDTQNKKHGIIDTKAYKEYSLSNDHRNRMLSNYIPKFRKIKFEDEIYDLAFFSYIAGGFKSSMKNSFEKLVSKTDVGGSYITSINFIRLLRKHRSQEIKSGEMISLFSSNDEITEDVIVA